MVAAKIIQEPFDRPACGGEKSERGFGTTVQAVK